MAGPDNNESMGTIEENLARIEKILEELDSDGIGLEESFGLYEEGLRLIRETSGSIDGIEKKIEILEGGDATDEL